MSSAPESVVATFDALKALARSEWDAGGRVATRAWTFDAEGVTRIAAVSPSASAWKAAGVAAVERSGGAGVFLLVQDDVPDLGPHVLAFEERANGARRGEVARIIDGVLGDWEPRDV